MGCRKKPTTTIQPEAQDGKNIWRWGGDCTVAEHDGSCMARLQLDTAAFKTRCRLLQTFHVVLARQLLDGHEARLRLGFRRLPEQNAGWEEGNRLISGR